MVTISKSMDKNSDYIYLSILNVIIILILSIPALH